MLKKLSEEERARVGKSQRIPPQFPGQSCSDDPCARSRSLRIRAGQEGAPAVVSSSGPINMRWQSTWPAKDIFHEYALDFAKKVNDMTGGDLKIEVLPAGAVVPAFGLLDAVSKGTLDGGHGVLVYHYGKQNALALWGSSPAFGMDGNMMLAWHKYGGGKELLEQDLQPRSAPTWCRSRTGRIRRSRSAGSRSRSPICRQTSRASSTARWASRLTCSPPWARRSNALPGGDIVPAMDRGLLDAAEFNNPTSDRLLGFPDVSKVYMMQSFHQNAEQFEIMFNKTKYDALPAKMQAIIANAVEAASADMSWKAIDRYSQDYIEMQAKQGVKVYKTPDSILQKQIEVFDPVMAKKSADNPLFKEVLESQKKFAERAVRWDLDTYVNRRMAYNYYFGKAAAKKKA